MSKRSRTFQPSAARPDPEDQPASSGVSGGAAGTPVAPPAASSAGKAGPSTSRAEARRPTSAPRATAQQSFFDRYRLLIVGGAGAVVVVLGLLFFTRSTTQAYECVTFVTPPPAAPTVAPGQTPLVGFQTQDMGKDHAVQGAAIRYDYCPPASGRHYNLGGGEAPLARHFLGPDDSVLPAQWIHNLEHGFVVLLYRGDPGTEVLQQMRSIMDDAVVSEFSQAQCGPVNKVIGLRFDDLGPGVNFAAVAWDRVLLQEEFDREQLLAFANQWQDGPQTPERVCA